MRHTQQEVKQVSKLQTRAYGLINALSRQGKITAEQATNFTYRTGYGALCAADVKVVVSELENIQRKPATWQLNPDAIDTHNVQFWRRGVMVTAWMTNGAAKGAVREGRAFVISSQAIGALIDGKMEG